jgi:hypothetical protein
MRRLVLAALLVATVVSGGEAHGVGGGIGGGTISGDTIIVGIIAPGSGGSPGGGTYSANDPAAPPPIRYVWIPRGGVPASFVPTCSTSGDPALQDGYPYILIVQDTAGNELSRTDVCVPLDPSNVPIFPPVPPVPTIGEIWSVAMRDIPPPGLGVNPPNKGLTGLDTWLWYQGATQVGVSTGIGVWSITGTAYLTAVHYETGDGATYDAGAGSPDAPAVRHVYETKGSYQLTVTGRWEADVVLSGPGLPGAAVPIGTAVLRSSYGYPVVEIRAVLVP